MSVKREERDGESWRKGGLNQELYQLTRCWPLLVREQSEKQLREVSERFPVAVVADYYRWLFDAIFKASQEHFRKERFLMPSASSSIASRTFTPEDIKRVQKQVYNEIIQKETEILSRATLIVNNALRTLTEEENKRASNLEKEGDGCFSDLVVFTSARLALYSNILGNLTQNLATIARKVPQIVANASRCYQYKNTKRPKDC